MWFFFLCPSWEMISLLFDYSFFDIPIFSLLINFCIGFFRTTKAVYYNTIAKSGSENCGWNVKRIKKKLSSLLYDVVAIKLVCSFSICMFFPSCRLYILMCHKSLNSCSYFILGFQTLDLWAICNFLYKLPTRRFSVKVAKKKIE